MDSLNRKEFIRLKCDLLVNGLRLKELRNDLINHQGWEEQRAAKFLPAELKLPGEILVQIRENDEANFRLRIIENKLYVQDRSNQLICNADFIPFPAFGLFKTSDGTGFKDMVVYNDTVI